MELLIKRTICWAVQIGWLWNLFNKTLSPLVYYAKAARDQISTRIYLDSMFSDMTVRHGVFKGMKYPKMTAIGSTLGPKLLGSYEKELEPLLERICLNQYTEIVDVGCAEGYYAVGLAKRIKTAKVFAFDTNRNAIQLCKEMARLNNVSERVITGSFCNINTLMGIPFTKKMLIISDCEGYEKELFSSDTVPFFAQHELLIETHDFIDVEISLYLRGLFEASHTIEVYSSIDDIKKAQQYSYEELKGLDLATKKMILAEHRPATMEWLYMKPREEIKSS